MGLCRRPYPVSGAPLTEQEIAEAEQRVTLGEYHILRQRALIAKLERDGHDTNRAKDVLSGFLARQEQQVSVRDWHLEELRRSRLFTNWCSEVDRETFW